MPQVVFSPAAVRDLERLRNFLKAKNPSAAKRAAEAIVKGVRGLGLYPQMGHLIDDMREQYREWLIDFGDSGYVVRYHLDGAAVTILAVRHQKEAGF